MPTISVFMLSMYLSTFNTTCIKIINEYLPEMYLIENGANYKTFKSYHDDDYIHVQYYKDNVVKKFCEITYVEDDCFTYVEKCSTPKMVYKKF